MAQPGVVFVLGSNKLQERIFFGSGNNYDNFRTLLGSWTRGGYKSLEWFGVSSDGGRRGRPEGPKTGSQTRLP